LDVLQGRSKRFSRPDKPVEANRVSVQGERSLVCRDATAGSVSSQCARARIFDQKPREHSKLNTSLTILSCAADYRRDPSLAFWGETGTLWDGVDERGFISPRIYAASTLTGARSRISLVFK
jgi:hypothetical protein